MVGPAEISEKKVNYFGHFETLESWLAAELEEKYIKPSGTEVDNIENMTRKHLQMKPY